MHFTETPQFQRLDKGAQARERRRQARLSLRAQGVQIEDCLRESASACGCVLLGSREDIRNVVPRETPLARFAGRAPFRGK